jgi:uncharacterized protein YbjT (DUF2867 family)
MATTERILITGATGNTGTALTQALEARGVPVRLLVRPGTTAPVTADTTDVVTGDFDDIASLERATTDIARAYLVTPSSPEAEARQKRFADVAAGAGVKHIVKLSQFAADERSPVRFLRYHAAVERHIRDLGIAYTFLRPNLYMQGLLAFRDLIVREGRVLAPIGAARVSVVDVRDIAAVAAEVLTGQGQEGQTYTITGPEAVTHAEIASAIGKAAGYDVTFVDVPGPIFAGALRGAGLPDWQVDGLLEDYAHYAREEAAVITSTVHDLTGRPPRDLAAFARDHAALFARNGPLS